MGDDLNHRSPHVLIFFCDPILLNFPMYENEQMVIVGFFFFDVFIYLYLGLVGGDKTYKIEPPDPITLSK